MYQSLDQEATNIFHQRNTHTEMAKCTTNAFVEQLRDTVKEIRNETSDRYQFFNYKQNINEPLEYFHSRVKQKAALCSPEDIEDSVLKTIFIQRTRNRQIKRDLLSEERDPLGRLLYALARGEDRKISKEYPMQTLSTNAKAQTQMGCQTSNT